jgi:hypothetical protein
MYSNRPGFFTFFFFFVLVANRWPAFVDRHAGGLSFAPRDVNAEEGGQSDSRCWYGSEEGTHLPNGFKPLGGLAFDLCAWSCVFLTRLL